MANSSKLSRELQNEPRELQNEAVSSGYQVYKNEQNINYSILQYYIAVSCLFAFRLHKRFRLAK